ncbi:hypothetical protein [Natrinema sp. 1APR25-10V2]|uniref:hypothetical protein n=1 Tax=Natrinema sp. 1APR25-10V2 TaxID=2951081 RepID=UPI0028769E8B|nr:hypothetical protein [Natrinema sp. 1APR25-10V2]MDS0476651.1 hypothetical protein [Natrinema sp. 1APR25-10V2]
MQFRNAAIVAVALLVILSGCSAFGGSQADTSPNETDSEKTEPLGDGDSNETSGETDPADGTASNASDGDGGGADDGDDTANATWSPPEEPNRPLEHKHQDRIESVRFVDKTPENGTDGYSKFNLEVVANTSMENVDPPEHGDVVGEPYFFVKINEDEQKIVERTGEVRMTDNGTFHIDVRPAGIEEFGSGPLTVEVFLMDEDKDWDDIYDAVGTEIQYDPNAGSDGATADGDGTTATEN